MSLPRSRYCCIVSCPGPAAEPKKASAMRWRQRLADPPPLPRARPGLRVRIHPAVLWAKSVVPRSPPPRYVRSSLVEIPLVTLRSVRVRKWITPVLVGFLWFLCAKNFRISTQTWKYWVIKCVLLVLPSSPTVDWILLCWRIHSAEVDTRLELCYRIIRFCSTNSVFNLIDTVKCLLLKCAYFHTLTLKPEKLRRLDDFEFASLKFANANQVGFLRFTVFSNQWI